MVSSKDYPRILFITPHAFNKVTGTGITFTNLFRGWPKDRIATVHDDSLPVTTDICETYYRLGDREIRKFGRALINRSAGQPEPCGVARAVSPAHPSILQAIKKFVFGDGLPQRGVLTPELEAWIAEFKPDVVYTILGSNGLMDIVEKVQKRFDLPLVVHIMDDWMTGAFRTGLLGPLQRRRMMGGIRRLIDKASLRLGICDAMCEAYKDRFGVPFQAFQNVVDTEAVTKYRTDPAIVRTPARIVYAGSIFAYAQRQSLIDCCQAVDQLSKKGEAIELHIYCPPSHIAGSEGLFAVGPAIYLHGPLTDDEEFFRTTCEADILLMPVNFDRASCDFVRYSMPTRVPAYMASGTPILVYGPEDVAQVGYAANEEWGLVHSKEGFNSLKEALLDLVKDLHLRGQLSDRSLKLASASHNSRIVQESFRISLSRLSVH